jgi:hypothetical protein
VAAYKIQIAAPEATLFVTHLKPALVDLIGAVAATSPTLQAHLILAIFRAQGTANVVEHYHYGAKLAAIA